MALRKRKKVGLIIVGVITMIGILGALVMVLWNNLIPELFHGPMITYWQALGLLVLCRLLVGKFGGGGPGGKERWKRKWEGMSPEQKENLKNRFFQKWCEPHERGRGRMHPMQAAPPPEKHEEN